MRSLWVVLLVVLSVALCLLLTGLLHSRLDHAFDSFDHPSTAISYSGAIFDSGQLVNFELIDSYAATDIKHFRSKRSTKISPTAAISPQFCTPTCTYRLRRHDGKELIVNLTSVTDWKVWDSGGVDNDPLVAPVVQYMDSNDSAILKNWTYSHCLFRAVVLQPPSDESRWSLVNLCDGMLGTLLLDDGVYFVEPVISNKSDNSLTGAKHVLYQHKPQRFAEKEITFNDENDSATRTIIYENNRTKRSTTSWDHYVEVLVVTDSKMFRYHQDRLENYVLTLFSTVATIYRHPSLKAAVNIVVVRLVVLKHERSGPLISENAQDTLKQFCAWQHGVNDDVDENPNHHDVAILLTREDICRAPGKCDTLGLAELGTICDRVRSCAIIEDNGLSAAFTIAHELGHIFNIPHDDEKKCGQYMALGKENYHIMAPTLEYNTHPWSWSECSSAVLQIFLDSGRASCLHDKPTQRKYMARLFGNVAPGRNFDVDQQCKFVFGPNAKLCSYMPSCKRLWCQVTSYYGYQVGCRTQHMPWADGTPCDNNRWCYRGHCAGVAPEQLEPVDGVWGHWKQWGHCSRTCGGGLKKAFRDCDNPVPLNGGRYCLGQRIRYKSCETQDCPWDTPNFREVQCSAFDNKNIGIHGVSATVKWTPKYSMSSSERCKLYCRVGGTAAFYLLKDKVEDGTPCSRYDDDICVDGTCRKAGCDRRLDSEIQRDKCGVCGGNGTSCRRVSGKINERRSFGYNMIMKIPAGATNIDIRQHGWNQMADDDNYLSLQNGDGEYILNGQYQVSVFRQEVPVRGTILEYSGSDTSVERINSTIVPTQEDLYLHILSVGNLYPPDIRYDYVIPTNPLQTPQEPTHYWTVSDDWSQCSKLCQGVRSQAVICVDREGETEMAESYCSDRPKTSPPERPCNIDCEFRWRTEPLSECSVQCGTGEQQQRIVCVQQYRDHRAIPTDDANCEHMTRPSDRVVCHRDCQGFQWSYGQWSECTVSCSGGISRRETVCVKDDNQPVDNGHCAQIPQEALERECNTTPCPQWVYSHWVECSKSCDGGWQMRHASCQDVAGRTADSAMCNQSLLLDRRRCNEPPCVQWKFGSWSECSTTCGDGVASRDAWCVNSNNDVLEDELCDKRQRIVSKPCKLINCPSWKLGEWSQCSQTCLDGWKQRRITCIDGNDVEIDDRHCLEDGDGDRRPPSHQPCNMGPCPFWRMQQWSACSVSCGTGQKQREMECLYRSDVVDPSYCDAEEQPDRIETCVLADCPEWEIGPWDTCSVTCGGGRQQRTVQCMPLGETKCDEHKKPKDMRHCAKDPCPIPITSTTSTTLAPTAAAFLWTTTALQTTPNPDDHPVKWITGPWTECSTTCDAGERRRQVVCRDLYARVLDDIYCSHAQKPVERESCQVGVCGQWLVGAWAPCSQSCGPDAKRRRQVSCVAPQSTNEVEFALCDLTAEPVQEESCDVPACSEQTEHSNEIAPDRRQAYWQTGSWEECSRTCGSGWRRRLVQCVPGLSIGHHTVFCDPKTRPRNMETCQIQPCPRWIAYRWTQCSVSCGNGVQYRRVYCAVPNGPTIEVAEAKCIDQQRPDGSRPCMSQPCPRPHWRTGTWSQCSTTCGKGVRQRIVECIGSDGRIVNDSYCPIQEKPVVVHRCRRARCPRWRRSKWSPCSVTCGEGIQQRNVACYRGRRHKVSDTDCAELPKPRQSSKCRKPTCPDYFWATTHWSNCSELCKRGEQYRQVQCMSELKQLARPRMCAHLDKPLAVRECVSPSCPYEWTPGAWSSCSRSCGKGVRYRSLHCRLKRRSEAKSEVGHQVNAAMCAALPKPSVTQHCSLGTCQADYYWSVKPWTHCSVTCGKGVQRRRVRCINRRTGKRVHRTHCSSVVRPPRRRMCFTRNCDPGDCSEIRQFSNVTQDGNFMVLVNGFKVQIYCQNMINPHPKTYLNLNPSANYAEVYGKRLLYPFTCPHEGRRNDSCLCANDGNPKAGKTRFEKVRVDLHNMKIDIHDLTFSQQIYGQQVAFGSAGDCYSAVDCPQGEFNVDLRHTGFRVADAVRWLEYGHRTASHIERFDNSAVIQGRCGGYCGQCFPDKWKGLLIEIDPTQR